jgi:hypothetical protein
MVIHRSGRYRGLIILGAAVMTLGTGLYLTFGPNTSLASVVVIELVSAVGCGILFQPPLIALQVMVPQNEVGTATGTFGFVRNLATCIGVVIPGVIFKNGMDRRASTLKAAGLSSDIINQFSGRNAEANVFLVSSLPDPAHQFAVKEAYSKSMGDMWIFYTCAAGMALLASGFVQKMTLSDQHVETVTGLIEKDPPVPEARVL